MKNLRLFLASLLMVGLFPLAGCQHLVSGGLDPEEISECVEAPDTCEVTPEAVTFAVIADYVRVKAAAVAYARQPGTSVVEIDAILSITTPIDEEIKALHADIEANRAVTDTYLRVANLVRGALLRLSAKLATAGVALGGGPEPNLVELLRGR